MPRSAKAAIGERSSTGVVVPAYNAEASLSACLQAIVSMTHTPDEIVVVDDGSTDQTAAIAHMFGVRVLTIASPSRGPAYARNMGVAALRSEFVMFVDSDVIVRPEALARMLVDMRQHRAIAAFGSYDDGPKSQRATSLYANLRHHYVHQHGNREASSFWSGLGLIDRRVFLDGGGFDEQRFRVPSIEDVELGARLIRFGHRIRLVPEALGMHCKDWRLSNVWWTDIVRRAYPWSVLIAEGKGPGADLNLATTERIKALFAVTTLVGIVAGIHWPATFGIAALTASAYLGLNAAFFAYLARRVRPTALIVAVLMHWAYHLYAFATYAATRGWVWAKRFVSRPGGSPTRLPKVLS